MKKIECTCLAENETNEIYIKKKELLKLIDELDTGCGYIWIEKLKQRIKRK